MTAIWTLRERTSLRLWVARLWATGVSAFALSGILLPWVAQAEDEIRPVDQAALNAMLAEKGANAAFNHAFEAGDELTEFNFTAEHGVGASVGEGRRFTRIPRADLTGTTEWSAHLPTREGGPNATSCIACHNAPIANGAGDIAVNVLVDPAHTGDPRRFLERNTLPLLALGVPQRLAEEMTQELFSQRDAMVARACQTGNAETVLVAKTIAFGTLAATRTGAEPTTAKPTTAEPATADSSALYPCSVAFDSSGLDGIDEDLVVKPFGWKGNHATIRSFTRGAAHNELGLQAVELIGGKDGDHDGVVEELTVGDITALTLYMAGLERPVTKLELADLGLAEVSGMEKFQILEGEALFDGSGCTACHIPEMKLDAPIFSEPSSTPGFFDVTFPSGAKPAEHALIPSAAIHFDLTADQPNNRIETANGEIRLLGALRKTADGGALAQWFSDFKRHDMGPALADPDAPLGIAAEMWPTRSLAGVGSTGPWLHDGRATTLDEAIRTHGGEASYSRDAYAALREEDREALIAFLENLVIFKQEEEEEP